MAKIVNKLIPQCLLKSHSLCRHQSSAVAVKTALYDFHVEHKGKIVDFGGYLLPVQYAGDSITQSHHHTRKHCSIFDVSHMLQIKVHGSDRFELLERLTTADVRGLPVNKCGLTVFTHPATGAILDDLIITNTSEGYLFVVSNAGRREHDSSLLKKTQEIMEQEKKDVHVELLEPAEQSLLAVQGPQSQEVLQSFCTVPLKKLPFMHSIQASVGGIPNCRITRCGYTGEDGFEVSLTSSSASGLACLLLSSNVAPVKLAGLGARDSLRLEAGLCLYGSDIDETTTPVEASLTWLLAAKRLSNKDFPGAEVICRQLKEGVSRRRVGLKLEAGPPARHGSTVLNSDGEQVGVVTSGGPSPSLGYPIAMAYLSPSFCRKGTVVQINVRGKINPATVVSLPFLPSSYYKLN